MKTNTPTPVALSSSLASRPARMVGFLFAALASLLLAGCETLNFARQPVTNAEISPMQTFAVKPATGGYAQIMATYPDKVRTLTAGAISEALVKKGYRPAGPDEEPDFTVSSLWMISTQNNPTMKLAGGNLETMQQIPVTIRVASIDVYVNQGDGGAVLWRNSSPWPFDINFATEADIENSVMWALDSFPVHTPAP